MKDLDRRGKTYKLDNLPQLASNCFKHRDKIGYTGSIVIRNLKASKAFWHYAIIYGFDKDGTLWLIENNSNGIECITWADFILEFDSFIFEHIETTPNRYSEIMKRALERSKLYYRGGENNCEHFANYCVFGELKSLQADKVKFGVDIFISIIEARILMIPNKMSIDLLNEIKEIRDLIGLERRPKLAKILNDHQSKMEELDKNKKRA